MGKSLQKLYEKTIQAFTQRMEVQQIYLFGSLERDKHDVYSDMDLHVVSTDFDTTMKALTAILQEIGEPFFFYPFHPQPGNTGYCVLFRDYSLYNHLDITILDVGTPPVVDLGRCIYTNPHELPIYPSTYQAPFMQEALLTLYSYAIGAVRYAKYRKRRSPFSCYKFYRAQCDYYFRQRCEDQDQAAKSKLALYQLLDNLPDSAALAKYLYPTDEAAMDRLYLDLLDVMLAEVATSLALEHREALVEIITFVRAELV